MLSYFRQRLHKRWFNFRCSGIDRTPPLQCDPDSNVVIVSQVYHPDTTMLMLAAKSFAQHLRPRGFVLVDDGLRPDDRARLAHHLGNVEFIKTPDAAAPGLPRGGAWERFATLTRQNQQHYVIQLDSDTLTLRRPDEVIACVQSQRPFTLGTKSGTHPVTLAAASEYAAQYDSDHVQNAAERALVQLPADLGTQYVRGCAGFTGFPPGTLSLDRIARFSGAMESLLGAPKWHTWGSEQVACNFMAANARDSIVLPVDRYPFWLPGSDIHHAALVHFFGTFRFTGGVYAQQGARLSQLLAGRQPR
ncbi:hypothetical protein [Aquincola tertiaricarbonis]|uniref:hypothetical protein n=1 Tax=Aquincola tertiaricarbonis TaxID=391953 RepID=UPI000614CCFA|nr:hypothetical protein [Aquincola tertiaricarbonis]